MKTIANEHFLKEFAWPLEILLRDIGSANWKKKEATKERREKRARQKRQERREGGEAEPQAPSTAPMVVRWRR